MDSVLASLCKFFQPYVLFDGDEPPLEGLVELCHFDGALHWQIWYSPSDDSLNIRADPLKTAQPLPVIEHCIYPLSSVEFSDEQIFRGVSCLALLRPDLPPGAQILIQFTRQSCGRVAMATNIRTDVEWPQDIFSD